MLEIVRGSEDLQKLKCGLNLSEPGQLLEFAKLIASKKKLRVLELSVMKEDSGSKIWQSESGEFYLEMLRECKSLQAFNVNLLHTNPKEVAEILPLIQYTGENEIKLKLDLAGKHIKDVIRSIWFDPFRCHRLELEVVMDADWNEERKKSMASLFNGLSQVSTIKHLILRLSITSNVDHNDEYSAILLGYVGSFLSSLHNLSHLSLEFLECGHQNDVAAALNFFESLAELPKLRSLKLEVSWRDWLLFVNEKKSKGLPG